MVDALAVQVGDEGAEQVHVVVAAAAPTPVHVAGRPLAEKLAQTRPRQRSDMGIGEMSKTEHTLPRIAATRAGVNIRHPAASTPAPTWLCVLGFV
jgi:hypothetical protein